jgi:hypothetical protein
MARRDSGIGWFFLGTGIGLAFSATAVILAAELTRKRYFRDPVSGQLVVDDYDPLENVAETLHTGLSMLAGAATGVTETFANALREKIRFGLDPGGIAGGGSHAWYTGDDDEEDS